MDYKWYILAGVIASTLLAIIIFRLRRRKPCEHKEAQKLLDEYLAQTLSSAAIGTFYERYIGHLYELEGYAVNFHGALNGVEDLGRDLVVSSDDEILIVQTKCWAKNRTIHEKHIFQLYGSMEHFKKTEKNYGKTIRAVFYTTAQYSDVAIEAAETLGVELILQDLDRQYPLVKCNVNQRGDKIYHLPFDPYYDKIRIDTSEDKVYVHTVGEAVARGFRRARKKTAA